MSSHIQNLGMIGCFTGAGAIAGAMGFGPVGAGIGALIGFAQSSTSVILQSIARGIFGKLDIWKSLALAPITFGASIMVTMALTKIIDIPMTLGAVCSLSASIGGIALGILFGASLVAGLVGLVVYSIKPELVQKALERFKPEPLKNNPQPAAA